MPWEYTVTRLAQIVGAPIPAADAAFSSVSTDTRQLCPGDLFVALRGPNFDAEAFVPEAFRKGAAGALCRGVHPEGPCVVVDEPLCALQAFAAYHRAQLDIPVLAITGSCGKTTAKDLTVSVLGSRFLVAGTEGNLNNEIGCPISLLRMDAATEFGVLELGANHPGEIAGLCKLVQPDESAITLIAPAHLEGFGSIEAVARAKGEIVDALPSDGCFYVNTDDTRCMEIAGRFPGEKVRFGGSGDVVLRSCGFAPSGEMALEIEPVGRLRLPLAVRAHAVNVLLAVAVGLRHGIDEFEGPLREACARMAHFRVVRMGPLEILDDSYNANPASMAAALQALADRPSAGARFAALGEMLELGGAARELHGEAGARAAAARVAHLYARGPHAPDMTGAARAAGVPDAAVIDEHRAMAEAIAAQARPGDVLLVKGSRGMRMEKVIEALRVIYAEQPGENAL